MKNEKETSKMEQVEVKANDKLNLLKKTSGVFTLNLNILKEYTDIEIEENQILVISSLQKIQRRIIGANGILDKQNANLTLAEIEKLKFFGMQDGYKFVKSITGQNPILKRSFTVGKIISLYTYVDKFDVTAEGIETELFAVIRKGDSKDLDYIDTLFKFNCLIVIQKIDIKAEIENAEKNAKLNAGSTGTYSVEY